MNHRLDQLCFLPPPASTPWSGSPSESTRCEIKRVDEQIVSIDVPLFWFDPAWHQVGTETADVVAMAIGDLGVLVSAMRSDLAGPGQTPRFHGLEEDDESDGSDERGKSTDEKQENAERLPRIVPYRPERYGLSDQDFDGARIIDLRLTMNRDESGRFAFSPDQIQRWEATPESEPLAGGGWVPAASFPPDVLSMQHLSSKLSQLRELAPIAAVFVSIGAFRLDDELLQVVAAKPDGVILRMDDLELDGLQLAALTRHARKLVDQAGATDLPLWIVPGPITPDDAVKLVALGATAVAIDSWCAEIIDEAEKQNQQSSRYSARGPDEEYIYGLVEDELESRIERFKGLFSSIGYLPPAERLASFNPVWGDALGVRVIPLPPACDP